MLLDNLYFNKYKILHKSIDFFNKNIPKLSNIKSLKIGCELEFYLTPSDFGDQKSSNYHIDKDLINELNSNPIFVNLVKEQGDNQYEIITKYIEDPLELAHNLELIKNKLKYYSLSNNICFNDNGYLFENDCGNALQFNISLHGYNDKNLFYEDNELLEIIAHNLLDATNLIIPLLTPNKSDFKRYAMDFNKKLFYQKKYTSPVNLCYGIDNRTCAIRITNQCFQPNTKRLEYRVASANADIYLSLSAIIIAISYALSGKKDNLYNLIYGNAFDNIYEEKNIPLITNNYDIALKDFNKEGNYIVKKMQEFMLST
jgi:glutamine synthetase